MNHSFHYDLGVESIESRRRNHILVFDVGATTIKYCVVDESGERLQNIRKRPTPKPLSPQHLIDFVLRRAESLGATKIAVGIPAGCWNGVVLEPGNLARVSSEREETSQHIASLWVGCKLEELLTQHSGLSVRVVNDALLAAFGCTTGAGRELMVTLGTGCGVALIVEGSPVKTDDFGIQKFEANKTFDEAVGESSRSNDERVWTRNVETAVKRLSEQFEADRIFLGGGNSLRLPKGSVSKWLVPVTIARNEAALQGAARLFAANAG